MTVMKIISELVGDFSENSHRADVKRDQRHPSGCQKVELKTQQMVAVFCER
jgi:hypothetical protein